MRRYFSKQCVTFGSALLLSLTAGTAAAESPADAKPTQKALISLESNFVTRWMTRDSSTKTSASDQASNASSDQPTQHTVAAAPRKPLIPPNSILNRNFPPESSPAAAATPLPPTTMTLTPAPAESLPSAIPLNQPQALPLHQPAVLPAAGPMAAPIATSIPAGVAQAQLVAAQVPMVAGQSPVIVVVPPGWQPDGTVTFAPRTIMSPEVPAEHWPTVERNPFGERSGRGMFTWPKFAKKLVGETLHETASVPAAPANESSKPLFAPSTQPQPVAEMPSKALFGPKPAAPPAPPAPESRALFALSRPAAPSPTEALPVANSGKSKALINLAGKSEAEAPAPEMGMSSEMAGGSFQATPPGVPRSSAEVNSDPAVNPPAPPELSDFETVPTAAVTRPAAEKQAAVEIVKSEPTPATGKPEMKWRSKGAPRSSEADTFAETTAGAPSDMSRTPEVQVVHPVVEVAPQPALQSNGISPPAAGVSVEAAAANSPLPSPTPSLPQTAPQPERPVAVSSGKALLANTIFSRKSKSSTTSHGHTAQPSHNQPMPAAAVASRPEEKAIVPSLMSMIPGLKDETMLTQASATESIPAETVSMPSETAAPQPRTAPPVKKQVSRATQSYYAPAIEYVAEEKPQPSRTLAESRRKTLSKPAPSPAVEDANRPVHDDIAVEVMPVAVRKRSPFDQTFNGDAAQEASSATMPRQPEAHVARAHSPSMHQAARNSVPAPAPRKEASRGYRRLTMDDVTSGFTRPLKSLDRFTKLPTALTPLKSDFRNSDLEEFESDKRDHYARPQLKADKQDDAVEVQQPLRRTARLDDSHSDSRRQAIDTEPAHMDKRAYISDEQQPSSGVIHNSRRRVVTPLKTERPALPESSTEPSIPHREIRNKSGIRVLIYSGEDLSAATSKPSQEESSDFEMSDSGPGNPLR